MRTSRAKTSYRRAAAVLSTTLFALVLATCNVFGPRPIYETTSAGIAVDTSAGSLSAVLSVGGNAATASRNLSTAAPLFAISNAPNPANIATMTVTVSGEDRFGVFQAVLDTATLVNNAGVWSVTLDSLPIGPALTFSVIAYDAIGDQLYDGTTTTTLSTDGETVTIVLQPSNRGATILFPIVRQIIRPAEIVRNTTANIDFDLSGSENETLDVVLSNGGGGTFTPPATTLSVGASGNGTLSVDYNAGSVVGTYANTVRVQNSQGNSTETEFDTTVVYDTGGAEIVIGIAPAVYGLSASRNGDQIAWSATVTDDGPVHELTYDWQFVRASGQSTLGFTNPTELATIFEPYDETASGEISLTVTDDNGAGLSTTVVFDLPEGLFPDDVVVSVAPHPELIGVYASGMARVNGPAEQAVVFSEGVLSALPSSGPNSVGYDPDFSGDVLRVAGRISNGGYGMPVVWTDGEVDSSVTTVSDGSVQEVVTSNGTVYAAGTVYDGNVSNIALWVDGVEQRITSNLTAFYGPNFGALEVVGSDIYLLYFDFINQNQTTVRLWYNGTVTDLSSGSDRIQVLDIHVDGSDVYIAGMYYDQSVYPALWRAVYWKNGVRTNLVETGFTTRAVAVATYAGDVYVVGTIAEPNRVGDVALWTNGVIEVVGAAEYGTTAYDMDISSTGDVYIAGYQQVAGGRIGTIWKNGTPIEVTDAETYASIYGIHVTN